MEYYNPNSICIFRTQEQDSEVPGKIISVNHSGMNNDLHETANLKPRSRFP